MKFIFLTLLQLEAKFVEVMKKVAMNKERKRLACSGIQQARRLRSLLDTEPQEIQIPMYYENRQ